ncbi:MAG: hypothetical protein QXD76_03090, partial [Sulfolobales archaeon]
MSSPTRRLVPISENIIREVVELSGRLGIPFRELIEKILSSFIEVSRTNPHLLNVIYDLDLIEDLRRVGGVALPQSFVYKFIDKLSEEDLEILKEELRKTASWLALLAKVKRGETLEVLSRILRVWLPDFKVDVIPNSSEKNTYKIIVSTPSHEGKVLELAESVVEGV